MTEETKTKSLSSELRAVPDDHPEPPHDLSWIIVAMDRNDEGWIMDASSGFDACDLLPNGNMCCDNGVVVPNGKPIGLYCMTNVKIGGGDLIQIPGEADDYSSIEIWSDDWVRLDCLEQAAKLSWIAADDARIVATELQTSVLEPFAKLGGGFDMQAYHDLPDDTVVLKDESEQLITAGDVRAARRAYGLAAGVAVSEMNFRRPEPEENDDES